MTRKHLGEVEKEARYLKNILATVAPSLNIEDAVKRVSEGGVIEQVNTTNPARSAPPSLESFHNQPAESESPQRDRMLQVPQLLSYASISENRQKDFSTHIQRCSDSTPESKFTWDERRKNEEDSLPTMIDGMATANSSSYLGSTLSAALLGLVGGGLFLHQRKNSTPGGAQSGQKYKPVPKLENLESYIERYFRTYHVLYPIVHRPLFMACLHQVIPSPSGWNSLMYIVAAIGSFLGATNPEENDDLALFDLAKKGLNIEDLERGNLTIVQTLTLISNYLQKRDRPNSGYNYMGLAVRMAMGLGLHKDFELPDESIFDAETRRRVWWCIYIFDCGQTITFGRPLGIPSAGIDLKLPTNTLDVYVTKSSKREPLSENGPTIYSSLRLQALFHLFTNGIYERIISDPYPSANELLQWDDNYIKRWESMIPTYFATGANLKNEFELAHAVLHWRCSNLRILMYRSFLLGQKDSPTENEFATEAARVCLQECRSTIGLMSAFWTDETNRTRMDAWYSLFFLIPAMLMPLVSLKSDPVSQHASSWRKDVNDALKIISGILNICPPATRIGEFVVDLGAGTLKGDTCSEPLANDMGDSPITQLIQLHLMLWPDSMLNSLFASSTIGDDGIRGRNGV